MLFYCVLNDTTIELLTARLHKRGGKEGGESTFTQKEELRQKSSLLMFIEKGGRKIKTSRNKNIVIKINTKIIAIMIACAVACGALVWMALTPTDTQAASSGMKMIVTGKDGMVTRYEDSEYKVVCYVFGQGYGAGCAKK
jgi:hypothetical protein